ncbi:hypothetical protein [Lapillicoccus jejuensis]|uniref:RES domain-containing protein n=1 Tax=Lapillicoccus jejuensis TaxID=402171 RepID=A0A542DVS5_9MICO|nr:hypothetical protein [Lapillicoccus jejuensis]TQJ07202.1 hypothetical protein FB458_0256 [Lapillicoccus jejuensis]
MTTRCPAPPWTLPPLDPGDVLDQVDPVLRIYSSAGPYAVGWSTLRSHGPVASMRFDHHPPPARMHPTLAVTYGTTSWTGRDGRPTDPFEVAVVERFRSSGVLDRTTDGPRFVLWAPTRPLRLLQLSDSTWVARAGGNAALTSGARGTARAWSRAIHRSYPDVDGLLWSSSVLPPGRSVVLYERARDAVPSAPDSDRALAEPFLQPALARIAGRYGLTLL